MKKIIYLLLAVVLCCGMWSCGEGAEDLDFDNDLGNIQPGNGDSDSDSDSDYETEDSNKYVDNFEKYSITDLFPDPLFRAYVLKEIDYNHDGRLSKDEALAVIEIDVSGREIEDLHGIGYFTSLQKLYCANNKLKELFLSKNTKLTLLHCYDNQLISLDISGCANLQTVRWDGNPFEYINLGDVTSAYYYTSSDYYEYPYFYDGKLGSSTKLKVISSKITKLAVNINKLQSLDVSGCTALTELYCERNQLTSLNVNDCTALEFLSCYFNQLINLDLSKTNLGNSTSDAPLRCAPMETLQTLMLKNGWSIIYGITLNRNTYYIPAQTDIIYVDEQGHEIIPMFPDPIFRKYVLYKFDKDNDGKISEEEAMKVTSLNCSFMEIESLDGVQYFTNLTYLSCSNNQLASLDVSQNTALTELRCWSNQLTSLNVNGCTALTSLKCYSNQLTSLDVSQNTALTDLRCYKNQLTDLDVSKNTALTDLNCTSNQLTDLDVSKNTSLTSLACDDNKLTSLDVSKNTELTYLWCYSNQLTDLDVSHNTELTTLWCNSNQLTDLDVSQNTELTSLNCSSNQLTELDVSKTNLGDSNVSYPLNCSSMPTLQTLTLKRGWSIQAITPNRSINYIPSQTEIVFVD